MNAVPVSTTNIGTVRNSPSASSPKISAMVMARPPGRHCEERSDEAIQFLAALVDCFASLAMTHPMNAS
jgi:hypothetical protein